MTIGNLIDVLNLPWLGDNEKFRFWTEAEDAACGAWAAACSLECGGLGRCIEGLVSCP